MANDETALGLTPEEIAERYRLAAELMRPGSLADLSPNFLAQRDQQLMARLLLDQRPMASTADLNAPAVPLPFGPNSAPFDRTPMFPPNAPASQPLPFSMQRQLPGAAEIVPPIPFYRPVGPIPPSKLPHDPIRSLHGLIAVRG
jgi:hypothetical protein